MIRSINTVQKADGHRIIMACDLNGCGHSLWFKDFDDHGNPKTEWIREEMPVDPNAGLNELEFEEIAIENLSNGKQPKTLGDLIKENQKSGLKALSKAFDRREPTPDPTIFMPCQSNSQLRPFAGMLEEIKMRDGDPGNFDDLDDYIGKPRMNRSRRHADCPPNLSHTEELVNADRTLSDAIHEIKD